MIKYKKHQKDLYKLNQNIVISLLLYIYTKYCYKFFSGVLWEAGGDGVALFNFLKESSPQVWFYIKRLCSNFCNKNRYV